MKKNKIIYSINVEDIQNVANDELERDLTDEEIESIIDLIGDNIGWYDAIADAISEKIGTLDDEIVDKEE
jgi:hypothetical protein